MSKKTYRLQTACPQCGCSAVSHLSPEEIKEKYGNVPHVEMECSACLKTYKTQMREACPEWADDCQSS